MACEVCLASQSVMRTQISLGLGYVLPGASYQALCSYASIVGRTGLWFASFGVTFTPDRRQIIGKATDFGRFLGVSKRTKLQRTCHYPAFH